jgi:ATP synthase protein I
MSVQPTDPSRGPQEADKVNVWSFALGAGTELVVCVLGGCAAGYFADRWLGTSPWLLLFGILSGIGLGLYQLIKAAGALNRR